MNAADSAVVYRFLAMLERIAGTAPADIQTKIQAAADELLKAIEKAPAPRNHLTDLETKADKEWRHGAQTTDLETKA